MIDERFAILAFFLNFVGGASYIVSTIKGKTKPNRVSWFMWALAPIIAFIAQIKQGVGLESLIVLAAGLNPLLIFIVSFFNKKSEWKLTTFDITCGVLSLMGVILWLLTRVGNVAIFFSIMADGLAALPTIYKSIKEPETENYMAFFVSAIAVFITLLTIDTWDFAHAAFTIYLLIVCLLLSVLIKFKLGKKIKFLQKYL